MTSPKRVLIRFAVLAAAMVAVAALGPAVARADGLIVVDCPPIVIYPADIPPAPTNGPLAVPPILTRVPPTVIAPRRDCPNYLSVKNHNVTVTIDDQVVRTRVDQTFVNDSGYQLEGTYVFPLPSDASISDFAMWVDGQRLEGQVLDSNQARQTYEDIVRRQRDPALLEYAGQNAFRASIFPIAPHGDKRVEIEYSQILKAQNGLVRYVYPLDTEKFSPTPIGNVSIDVTLKSRAGLKAIYSPTHDVSITRNGEHAATVSYEASQVTPDRDFVLYYSVSEDSIGLNLLSFKAGGDDGFFVMLVAPKVQIDAAQVVSRDVVLVLDTSGSMQGQKIAQAKSALNFVLDHLNPGDRFDIVAFNSTTRTFASSLRGLSSLNDARDFVASLRAEGSTNINRALLEALSTVDPSRPTAVLFLTDGLPTTGETDTQRIIGNVTRAAGNNVRLFAFGVGNDVNTSLLDTLSERLKGASDYVRPDERIDEIVSTFYAQVSTPVLSDISVDWGGIPVSDVFPYPLPDLFAGSQLVIAGRYQRGGAATITLKGVVNGQTQAFRYPDVTFSSSDERDRGATATDFVPRLWATRKIGYLLSQVRLDGESKEAVDEVVSLAVRYGIVTPYTSFLVDDRSDVLTESGRNDAAQDLLKSFAPSAMPTSGASAVQQSLQQSQLRGAGAPPAVAPQPAAPGSPNAAPAVQTVGDKTFLLRGGIWSDTQFDAEKMNAQAIAFGSDAYFALLRNHPEWAGYMALGTHVIFVADGSAFEIADDGSGATDAAAVPTPALGSPTPDLGGLHTNSAGSQTYSANGSGEPQSYSDLLGPAVVGGALGLGGIGLACAVALVALRRR